MTKETMIETFERLREAYIAERNKIPIDERSQEESATAVELKRNSGRAIAMLKKCMWVSI